MYTFYFEKLDVWKDSIELIKSVYQFTKYFPEEEKYGVTSQIRRSSISISTNISEGNSRSTRKDQANFTTMAYSSLMETLNLAIISIELGYLNKGAYLDIRSDIEKIANKLNALRKSQLRKTTNN
jgi:four helix bundle protein